MMSDGKHTPTKEWYYIKSDRSAIGQRKIEELKKQILLMENDVKERQALIHKLNLLQNSQNEKKGFSDKVLERNSPNNPGRLLQSEMKRLYGKESENERITTPLEYGRTVVDTVMHHRTKEFSAKQQEAALRAKYLDKERLKLQEARRRVEEQRHALLTTNSPVVHERVHSEPSLTRPKDFNEPSLTRPKGLTGRNGQFSLPESRDVQGVDMLIKQTVQKLPDTMDKIWQMRENLQKHYQYYNKPYLGELGLASYEPWQVPDYFICHDIVKDVVDDFLNLNLPHDDIVEGETYKAMLEEEKVWMKRQSESLAEKNAINLIAEEFVLDVTGDIVDKVAREMQYMYGMFQNITNQMFMSAAEVCATGQDKEHDPTDKAHQMVTKSYFSMQQDRKLHRPDIWRHTQPMENRVGNPVLVQKKNAQADVPLAAGPGGGKKVIEQQTEEVFEDEEEEEDIDASDLTIIDFNTISPVQLHSLELLLLDTPEVCQEKEAYQFYVQRKLEYWAKIQPTIHQLNFNKICNGITLIRVSLDHQFIVVGFYYGPHFAIFSMDLTSMKLRDFHTDILLSPQEYILAMKETII